MGIFNIELSDELHKKIKLVSLLKDMTMQDYMLIVLTKQSDKDEKEMKKSL